jgi:hypothetical protein
MSTIGVDPGKEGGIAVLFKPGEEPGLFPMPVLSAAKGRDEYDTATIRRIFALISPADHVVIEKLQPMPLAKGGTIANFNRGAAGHLFIGLCVGLGLSYTLVAPQTWQKVMLLGTPGEDTKQRSILAAQRLFPGVSLLPTERSRKPSDGLSDALLIAEWGRRTLGAQAEQRKGA